MASNPLGRFMTKRGGFATKANPDKHPDTVRLSRASAARAGPLAAPHPAPPRPAQTNLTDCEGWLKKLSSKGMWQSRYFVLHNTYLNYYGAASKATLLASIDLAKVRA